MSGVKYYSKEGLERLNEELNHMKSVQRPDISRQIAEARDKGDLSENAEYDAAKEAQGMLEMKIAQLENELSNARVMDDLDIDTSKALVLSTVKVKNLKFNKEFVYTLVSASEADLKQGKISIESPIGKGLFGKQVGDIAEIQAPSGLIRLELLEITR